MNRKLYKAVDVTFVSPRAAADFKVAAIDKIRSLGLDPAYALVDDSPSDTPYKPYDPDAAKPVNQIFVEGPSGAGRRSARRPAASTRFRRNTACCDITFPSESEMWLFRSPQST